MKESSIQNDMIAFTKAGVILPTISGSLSFISSCLIMITILRSKQNTAYHRIMFFMSFWDSLSSLSIALTTIPMPKDVVYDYVGPSYGNTRTCEAQASIILLGTSLVLLSNILLNVYYLCAIRYNVSDDTFRHLAEPIFLLTAIPLSLFQPVFNSINGTFHPTPYFTFCMTDVIYPRECILSKAEEECILDTTENATSSVWSLYRCFGLVLGSLQFLVLCITMCVIVQTARRQQKEVEISRPQLYSDTNNITLQAFMYICACMLTWIFASLFEFFKGNRELNALTLFFFPMQGFFHFFIFMYHKVYSLQKINNLSTRKALKTIVLTPWKVYDNQQLVDNLEIVDFDTTLRHKVRNFKHQKASQVMHDGDAVFLPNLAVSAKKSENDFDSKDLSVQHANSVGNAGSLDENVLKNFFIDSELSVKSHGSVFSSPY